MHAWVLRGQPNTPKDTEEGGAMNGTDYDRVIGSECVFLRPDDNMGYPQIVLGERCVAPTFVHLCACRRGVPFAWIDISQLAISFANVAG